MLCMVSCVNFLLLLFLGFCAVIPINIRLSRMRRHWMSRMASFKFLFLVEMVLTWEESVLTVSFSSLFLSVVFQFVIG